MSKLSCYRVTLECRNILARDAFAVGLDRYVEAEGGVLYVVATDVAVVAREFPAALEIKRVGTGYDAESSPVAKTGS
jgi:hypothetical protein